MALFDRSANASSTVTGTYDTVVARSSSTLYPVRYTNFFSQVPVRANMVTLADCNYSYSHGY